MQHWHTPWLLIAARVPDSAPAVKRNPPEQFDGRTVDSTTFSLALMRH